ncbi:MAG: hypothetical protein KUG77_14465 [Nannocystaceae bacterium]|nr:hypothetical protein [Nannocystaceae bacterium]
MTALALLVSALTMVGAEPALPEGVQVRWTGAPGCPDAAAVEARIARRLENRKGPLRASVVIALVSNAQGGYGLSLDVELATETVHRELESSDCEVLVEATAVVVGIAIEPESSVESLRTAQLVDGADLSAVPQAPPPSSADIEAPEPEPEPEPLSVDEESPADSRHRSPLGGFVRVHGGAGVGLLPGLWGRAGVRLGMLGPRWRVEVGADRTFRTRATFPAEPDVGAEFTMWSGTTRGCYVPARGRLEFPMCVGGSGGLSRAEGFGGARNRQVRSWWIGAVVAPSLVWRPHPNLGLGASADALVVLRRPVFSGEERPDLYTTAPVAVQALGFVELRWGS